MTNTKEPRQWWINDVTGGASEAEESIPNGYHIHVIEFSAYLAIQEKLREKPPEKGGE